MKLKTKSTKIEKVEKKVPTFPLPPANVLAKESESFFRRKSDGSRIY